VGGHLLIGGIQIRFIAARTGDGILEVIRNQQCRSPFKELQCPDVGADP
jgi:hypothetical protein